METEIGLSWGTVLQVEVDLGIFLVFGIFPNFYIFCCSSFGFIYYNRNKPPLWKNTVQEAIQTCSYSIGLGKSVN